MYYAEITVRASIGGHHVLYKIFGLCYFDIGIVTIYMTVRFCLHFCCLYIADFQYFLSATQLNSAIICDSSILGLDNL